MLAVLNRGKLCYFGAPQDMTRLAEGKVWQFKIEPAEFEALRNEHQIIHHIRDGEKIRVRCLAAKKPVPEAKNVLPSLEDAYLWLLRKTEERE